MTVQERTAGKIMPDMEHFYELLTQVKKANRRYMTNCYLNRDVLTRAVEQREITYVYREGEFLNLWWRREDFKRLYYFIADTSRYEAGSGYSVCDMVCKGGELAAVCRVLTSGGLKPFASYGKWVCESPAVTGVYSRDDVRIRDGDDGRLFMDSLNLYFDKRTDLLPDAEEQETFIREKEFIGVYDKCRDRLRAGMVYTKRESAVTEDFVFVVPDFRGQGLSRLLHNTVYKKYAHEKVRYTAWIGENNERSIALHKSCNYKKQDQLKVTFLREGES